ncbi:MAG: hypothetical protein Q9162_005163 [Coniocarpon cinnabarinum]
MAAAFNIVAFVDELAWDARVAEAEFFLCWVRFKKHYEHEFAAMRRGDIAADVQSAFAKDATAIAAKIEHAAERVLSKLRDVIATVVPLERNRKDRMVSYLVYVKDLHVELNLALKHEFGVQMIPETGGFACCGPGVPLWWHKCRIEDMGNHFNVNADKVVLAQY